MSSSVCVVLPSSGVSLLLSRSVVQKDTREQTLRITHLLRSFFVIRLLLFFFFFSSSAVISSGTDEVRAKRDPSLCNESVNGYFWSNLCLNCIFKWTWFVKTDIWSIIDSSRVRFLVGAALIIFSFFPHFSLFFWLSSSSVPLEFPKLANAQPSNFGHLRIFPIFRVFQSLILMQPQSPSIFQIQNGTLPFYVGD